MSFKLLRYLEAPLLIVHDEQTLQELQQELHTEIYPGTEIMTDVGSHHFVKGSKDHQVLVPQPSDDEHDPLVSLELDKILECRIDEYVELEPVMERFNDIHGHNGIILTGIRPFSTCAYVRVLHQRF